MAGAPGFVRYPQKPAPDPQALGMALMQRAQQQQGGMMPGMEQEPDEPDMDQDDPMRPRPRWRF